MKFTNGFWMVRDEYIPSYVCDFHSVREDEEGIHAYAPYRKIESRGDQLNTGMMTYTF